MRKIAALLATIAMFAAEFSSVSVALALLFLIPFTANAAIAYDTSSDLGVSGTISSSPASYSYTVTGSNPAIVVGVVAAGTTITSITWNGTALTQITSQNDTGLGGNRVTYLYALTGAASGTHNIVFTYTGGSGLLRPKVSSYSGVGLTTDGSGKNEQSATNLTVTQTTTIANDWLVAFYRSDNSNTAVATAGAGTTARKADNYTAIMDSNGGLAAGANSTTANFSGSPTSYNEGVQVALEPVATPAVSSSFGYFNSFWW
jgi:hypothetical protein